MTTNYKKITSMKKKKEIRNETQEFELGYSEKEGRIPSRFVHGYDSNI